MQINNPVKRTLLSLKAYWITAILFSVAVNMLLLVTPVYMLQIYDRVLTSGSLDTLILLSIMAAVLLAVFAAAESGRRRVFALIGDAFGERLNKPVFRAGLATGGRTLETDVGHLARVQSFFVNGLIAPLFDAPFVPLFILLIFFIHPALGALSLVGALILIALAVATELSSQGRQARARQCETKSNNFLSGLVRQSNAIFSMGMASRMEARWRKLRHAAMEETLASSGRTGFLSSVTKSVRQTLQVASLGLGAFLVLNQQVSAGAIIAVSIIMGRALAPIDQLVGSWRQIVDVRAAWQSLATQLKDMSLDPTEPTLLPRPDARLDIDKLDVACPGSEEALFSPPELSLAGGEILYVAGPSGGGKTSFLQTVSGLRRPLNGAVLLGGRSIHDWDTDDRGRHIGYLPQNVELLPGSVIDNISRFAGAEPEKAFAAAEAAGCHETVLRLTDGYDTVIGAGGAYLSAGQRQLIGVARAIYDNPALVLFDEPTANIDARSIGAVLTLLAELKRKGTVVIVATHDLRLLQAASHVLTLQAGKAVLNTQPEYAERLSRAAKAISMERKTG